MKLVAGFALRLPLCKEFGTFPAQLQKYELNPTG
jgi:hypothetical protein